MVLKIFRPSVVIVLGGLYGCSFSADSLLPTLTGEDPAGSSKSRIETRKQESRTPQQDLSRSSVRTSKAAAVSPKRRSPVRQKNISPMSTSSAESSTKTFVGNKVIELRRELRRLQSNVSKNNGSLQQLRANSVQHAENYQTAVAIVNSRLQVGTTPGNPVLVKRFNNALGMLNRISEDISSMNKLTTKITSDSTLAAFLSEQSRAAFRVSGALDKDHQNLAMLEDEVNRTVVLVDRLLKELSEDIQRQTNFVAIERSNLNTLSTSIKSGEIMGASLTNRALTAATSKLANRGPVQPTSTVGRRPLVVIRFDRKDVAYEQALYNAVNRALERRPGSTFSLVAVTPNLGGAAKVALNRNKARRNAERVLKALQRMGLSPQRVALSERTGRATSTEVHLYIN